MNTQIQTNNMLQTPQKNLKFYFRHQKQRQNIHLDWTHFVHSSPIQRNLITFQIRDFSESDLQFRQKQLQKHLSLSYDNKYLTKNSSLMNKLSFTMNAAFKNHLLYGLENTKTGQQSQACVSKQLLDYQSSILNQTSLINKEIKSNHFNPEQSLRAFPIKCSFQCSIQARNKQLLDMKALIKKQNDQKLRMEEHIRQIEMQKETLEQELRLKEETLRLERRFLKREKQGTHTKQQKKQTHKKQIEQRSNSTDSDLQVANKPSNKLNYTFKTNFQDVSLRQQSSMNKKTQRTIQILSKQLLQSFQCERSNSNIFWSQKKIYFNQFEIHIGREKTSYIELVCNTSSLSFVQKLDTLTICKTQQLARIILEQMLSSNNPNHLEQKILYTKNQLRGLRQRLQYGNEACLDEKSSKVKTIQKWFRAILAKRMLRATVSQVIDKNRERKKKQKDSIDFFDKVWVQNRLFHSFKKIQEIVKENISIDLNKKSQTQMLRYQFSKVQQIQECKNQKHILSLAIPQYCTERIIENQKKFTKDIEQLQTKRGALQLQLKQQQFQNQKLQIENQTIKKLLKKRDLEEVRLKKHIQQLSQSLKAQQKQNINLKLLIQQKENQFLDLEHKVCQRDLRIEQLKVNNKDLADKVFEANLQRKFTIKKYQQRDLLNQMEQNALFEEIKQKCKKLRELSESKVGLKAVKELQQLIHQLKQSIKLPQRPTEQNNYNLLKFEIQEVKQELFNKSEELTYLKQVNRHLEEQRQKRIAQYEYKPAEIHNIKIEQQQEHLQQNFHQQQCF